MPASPVLGLFKALTSRAVSATASAESRTVCALTLAKCALDEAAVESSPKPVAEERSTKNTEEERAHTERYCRGIGFRASMPT